MGAFDWRQLQELLALQLKKRENLPVPRLIPNARKTGFAKSFDDTPIFWEMHGPDPADCPDKTPLVFCYGLVCSMNQWRKQLEYFSPHHPCLLIDYRGHHKSPVPSNKQFISISALAKDVAAAIKEQQFNKPVHILGHSLGCNVALELALAEPAMCSSLTLICGTLNNPFQEMFGTNVLEKVMRQFLNLHPEDNVLVSEVWRWIIGQTEVTKAIVKIAGFNDTASTLDDMDTYVKAVAAVDPKVFFPLLSELTGGMSHDVAKRIKTPSLVIAGARDHVTPRNAQKEMAAALFDADYAEIPAGSHNVQLDFGEYICLKVEEFWRKRKLAQ